MSIEADGGYQRCVVVAKDTPPFVAYSGTRWAPQDFDVNLWFSTRFSHVFGNRRWRDSRLVYGDVSVFFDR